LAEEEDAEVGEVVEGCDAGVERSAAKLVEQARVKRDLLIDLLRSKRDLLVLTYQVGRAGAVGA
jgi:hypothetical protein